MFFCNYLNKPDMVSFGDIFQGVLSEQTGTCAQTVVLTAAEEAGEGGSPSAAEHGSVAPKQSGRRPRIQPDTLFMGGLLLKLVLVILVTWKQREGTGLGDHHLHVSV